MNLDLLTVNITIQEIRLDSCGQGFYTYDEFAANCSAELLIPAFTRGKKQLGAPEVESSRKKIISENSY